MNSKSFKVLLAAKQQTQNLEDVLAFCLEQGGFKTTNPVKEIGVATILKVVSRQKVSFLTGFIAGFYFTFTCERNKKRLALNKTNDPGYIYRDLQWMFNKAMQN